MIHELRWIMDHIPWAHWAHSRHELLRHRCYRRSTGVKPLGRAGSHRFGMAKFEPRCSETVELVNMVDDAQYELTLVDLGFRLLLVSTIAGEGFIIANWQCLATNQMPQVLETAHIGNCWCTKVKDCFTSRIKGTVVGHTDQQDAMTSTSKQW